MTDSQTFWKDPDGSDAPERVKGICRPSFYLSQSDSTNYICDKIFTYCSSHDSITELGCGTGRNLARLRQIGFSDVSGIEINQNAIDIGRKHFKFLADVPILCSSIEAAIKDYPMPDCFFTFGVLMHLPPSSEWVFAEMAAKARKVIITLELEDKGLETRPLTVGGKVFAWGRNYGQIFQGLGWYELHSQTCEVLGPLLGKENVLRVFDKRG